MIVILNYSTLQRLLLTLILTVSKCHVFTARPQRRRYS